MMKIALFLTLACSAFANNLKVVKHKDLKTFSLNGNSITSVANPMLGSNTFEVWRTQWSPGCCTPPHTHETEEIFVFLKGKVIIDDQEMHFNPH